MNIFRLVDVFMSGPLQFYTGTLLNNILLSIYMMLLGIMTIVYNGHNFLCLGYNHGCISAIPTHPKMGKYQIHRLYNLLVMYPIMMVVSQQKELPNVVRYALIINIVIGFTFNLFNCIKYLNR